MIVKMELMERHGVVVYLAQVMMNVLQSLVNLLVLLVVRLMWVQVGQKQTRECANLYQLQDVLLDGLE
jgi:hypothetical protein